MLQLLISQDYSGILVLAVLLVVALSLHEFAHALAADLMGDPTARVAGRLTLDPRVHLDPFGALMMVLVGFGWGKPVPYSSARLGRRRGGVVTLALAGPAANVALALAFAGALSVLGPAPPLVQRLLLTGVGLNVVLAIFNLLPIPPLDGGRILYHYLPPSRHHVIEFLDRWGFLILLLGLFFLPELMGFLSRPIIGLLIPSAL